MLILLSLHSCYVRGSSEAVKQERNKWKKECDKHERYEEAYEAKFKDSLFRRPNFTIFFTQTCEVLKDANISRIHYSIQEIITLSYSSCDLPVTVSVEFTHNNFMKHATLFYCTVKGLCFIFLIKKGNDNNKDPIGSPHSFDKKSRCTRTLMSNVEKASSVVTNPASLLSLSR